MARSERSKKYNTVAKQFKRMLEKDAVFPEGVTLDRIKQMSLDELEFFHENMRDIATIANIDYRDYLRLSNTKKKAARSVAKVQQLENDNFGYKEPAFSKSREGYIPEEQLAFDSFMEYVDGYDTRGSNIIKGIVGNYLEQYGDQMIGLALLDMPTDMVADMQDVVEYQDEYSSGFSGKVKKIAQYFSSYLAKTDISNEDKRRYASYEPDAFF